MGGGDKEENMQTYYSIVFQGSAVTRKERVETGSVNSLSFRLRSKTELKPEAIAGEKGGEEAKQKQDRVLLIFFLGVIYKKIKI